MHRQPPSSRLVRPLIAAAGMAVALSACSVAQVRMPEGFSTQATAFDVSGHSPRRFNEPVRFGPYSALDMHEGFTFSWAIPAGNMDLGRTAKPYSFTMIAIDQPPVQVQCRVRTWNVGMDSMAGKVSRRLEVDLTGMAGPMMACGLQLEGEPVQPLELSRTGTRIQGRLLAPWGAEYAVRSIAHMQGSSIPSSTPTGYEISGRDGIVAVVDVLNAGRVHLDERLDAERRVYFAAASAALLLLDPGIDD